MKDGYRDIIADIIKNKLTKREKRCLYIGLFTIIGLYMLPMLLILIGDLVITIEQIHLFRALYAQ